jgi:prolyl-tRNA synthetase
VKLKDLLGRRYKEKPSEAAIESHAILLRGGYARQVANGIYSLLPPGLRVIRRIEAIVREEMNRIGGQEVLMPLVLPAELWQESGRYASVGAELIRFADRAEHPMLLGMTHEEAVVHLARGEAGSYKQYPFMLYQVQTKFRDEPRSRGGLIRCREFTMKDAYSFHTSQGDLDAYYARCSKAYQRIFSRVGLPQVVAIRSDPGMMGGKVAHEFMLLAECGEDTVVVCDTCDYRANLEVAQGRVACTTGEPLPLEKVHTPGMQTIEQVAGFLKVKPEQTAKAVFYEADAEGRLVLVLVRGDLQVNEAKVAKLLKTQPVAASDHAIRRAGSVPGYASPLGLQGCRVIADPTVSGSANLVCGANEEGYHYRNFSLSRDAASAEVADVAQVRLGDGCALCAGRVRFTNGIEVGNIFQLGSRYTQAMGMRYLDESGKEQTPLMGCYGIGIGRLMSSIIEAHHDQYGPIWPVSVAPWQVHLIAINLDAQQKTLADAAYAAMQAAGVEVIYDDRDERPGVQFAEADLLGAPLRLVFSAKNLAQGKVEWKKRGADAKGFLDIGELGAFVAEFLKAEREALPSPTAVSRPQAS